MNFTVFGAGGFIGGAVVRCLLESQHRVLCVHRGNIESTLRSNRNLGHVIYCIGVTGDFIRRPLDMVETHVSYLARLLHTCNFESLLYLSSTRVYQNAVKASEDVPLVVEPSNSLNLYNITKLAGEGLCLSIERPDIRVARLSNVFGSGQKSHNFLASLIQSAQEIGSIKLEVHPDSVRDFIDVFDVVNVLVKIATTGRYKIYNVASGQNASLESVARFIADLTGSSLELDVNKPKSSIPTIDILRISGEFGFRPTPLFDRLMAIWPELTKKELAHDNR
jgi:nucleoside-diphosphate-sugar epimerase